MRRGRGCRRRPGGHRMWGDGGVLSQRISATIECRAGRTPMRLNHVFLFAVWGGLGEWGGDGGEAVSSRPGQTCGEPSARVFDDGSSQPTAARLRAEKTWLPGCNRVNNYSCAHSSVPLGQMGQGGNRHAAVPYIPTFSRCRCVPEGGVPRGREAWCACPTPPCYKPGPKHWETDLPDIRSCRTAHRSIPWQDLVEETRLDANPGYTCRQARCGCASRVEQRRDHSSRPRDVPSPARTRIEHYMNLGHFGLQKNSTTCG